MQLGGTVEELKLRMTWREFVAWSEYYKLEPFGEFRADLRQAHATACLISAQAGKKIKVSDCLLQLRRGDGNLSVEDKLRIWTNGIGRNNSG